MRKIFFIILVFVGTAGIALPLFSADFRIPTEKREAVSKDLGLFTDVILLIRANYVEETPVKKLSEGAISGMLKSLDPYSQYLDAEAYRDLENSTKGEFGGMGIEVTMKNGFLYVIAPLDDSPAAEAGIREGDTILKIDDFITRDATLHEAVKHLKGAPGSKSTLTVVHEGDSHMNEIVIKRDTVKIKSIKEAKILENGIGYIRLSAFQETSADDLDKALDDLRAKGMKGLVLDVRNNAGGLLSAAVQVTSKFVPKGQPIVSTKGRSEDSVLYISDAPHQEKIDPLVILVNKGSASASEILAGAIQDYGLGKIVGTKTFGKGSVQKIIPLKDGTAVRLTTSHYYTAKGRLIHEIGIQPDIVVEVPKPKEGETGVKDLQLEKAIEVIKNG